MGKPVTGYLANDGSFHETEAEADFRDAEEEIRNWCVTHIPPIDDNALLEYVEALADPIYRYLNAKDRIDVEVTRKEVTQQSLSKYERRTIDNYIAAVSYPESNQVDNQSTEDQLASLLEQPPDRHEPVPDVGSGASTEGVLDERPSNGIGGRKRHARGIRGGSTLAVDDTSEAT